MISRNKIYQQFPRTNKSINAGEIWLAYYPYREIGGVEKLRPVYVKETKKNGILVYKLTTNKDKGTFVDIKLGSKNRFKKFNKKSYIDFHSLTLINEEKFYSKLKSNIEIKEEK